MVYLSPQADTDLENIFEQIQHHSPQNADEFLSRVESVLEQIDQAPLLQRLRNDELPIPGLRFANADPAVLIYKALENGDAEVVRIAHKRQHLPALFTSFDSGDEL